ncbi:hypothetical protein [Microtetraspora sp. NBRC 13810]|uniref:hypothetical protein n=1 Tax=Microtetraspora sp. NBRC 13810 TaxID=3030990 RepID=UPI002554B84E|nr:hypothetical protein [Microtetraspora sp. NBRC 13810]
MIEAVRGIGDELRGLRVSGAAGALRPLLPELAEVLPAAPDPLDDRMAERHRVFSAPAHTTCCSLLSLMDLETGQDWLGLYDHGSAYFIGLGYDPMLLLGRRRPDNQHFGLDHRGAVLQAVGDHRR